MRPVSNREKKRGLLFNFNSILLIWNPPREHIHFLTGLIGLPSPATSRARVAEATLYRKGFNLIETTAALAIAAILSATTLPSALRFLDRIEVRGAVTEIEALFSVARHVAIARGALTTLEIDAPRNTLTIRVGGNVIRARDVGAAHGVSIASNRSSITYSPIGMGYGASNFTLVVSRNRIADSIIVSRLGRVRH